jgi:hypothetical protein
VGRVRDVGDDLALSILMVLVLDTFVFFGSPETGNWTLLEVIMPDEGAGIRNSSAYTNAIAASTMR